jgi:hypothetical protein
MVRGNAGGLTAKIALGRIHPQALEIIKISRLLRENMYDDVPIIHQNPTPFAIALNAKQVDA